MDKALEWLGNNAVDVIGLLATLGLLGVTWMYARTTKAMAKTSEVAATASLEASEAAQRSAEAALDAARVAQSQIKADFEARDIVMRRRMDHTDPGLPTVGLRSIGDPVVVHAVRIRRAFMADDSGEVIMPAAISDEYMVPAGEVVPPRRLHRGEEMHFTHEGLLEVDPYPIRRFLLDVEYGFSEVGGPTSFRQLVISQHDREWSSTRPGKHAR